MKRIPAAILGGGPSLVNDLPQLPPNCILISVNEHAFWHCEPHVLVYQDPLRMSKERCDIVEYFNGLVVCPFANSDVQLPVGWWDANQSSCLATWYALWMNYDPIILCGMDCYQGDVKYCRERPGYHHPIFDIGVEHHLTLWRGAFDHCPHPERIKAMSGPLVEVFGQYQKGE